MRTCKDFLVLVQKRDSNGDMNNSMEYDKTLRKAFELAGYRK